MTPIGRPPGSPATDLAVLRVLAEPREAGGLPNIAHRAGVGESTARRAVRRLQAAGLATCPQLPGAATPTEQGRARLEQAAQAEQETVEQARLRQLSGRLEAVAKELRALAGGTREPLSERVSALPVSSLSGTPR
jgi:predicted transcriptional regulator